MYIIVYQFYCTTAGDAREEAKRKELEQLKPAYIYIIVYQFYCTTAGDAREEAKRKELEQLKPVYIYIYNCVPILLHDSWRRTR